MKLKSILAIAVLFSAPLIGHTAESRAQAPEQERPEYSDAVINKNPLTQIEAAKRLVIIYCQQATTETDKGPYGNWRHCYGEVMRTYLAQLVADTAPHATFKDLSKED